jgi:hypothetical protein
MNKKEILIIEDQVKFEKIINKENRPYEKSAEEALLSVPGFVRSKRRL